MKWYVCGGREPFRSFLKELCAPGDEWFTFSSLEEIPLCSGKEHIYFLLPDYDRGEKCIPCQSTSWMDQVRQLIAEGTPFYVENYFAQDYLHAELLQGQLMGRERYLFQEYIEFDGSILQSRDGFFFPGFRRVGEVIGRLSNCIGTHKVFREGTYSFPVIIRRRQGKVLSALTDLSNFDSCYRRPYKRWKETFGKLFAPLLEKTCEEVEKAFEKHFPDVIGKYDHSTPEEAVRRAAAWHEKAGLFCAPDGSAGMFEMIQSSNLQLRRNLRTDATLLTAALYAVCGKVYSDEKRLQTGCNLADFLFARGIQRADGFFKWLDHSLAVWASDCGRGGLAIWKLYKVTGKEEYRRSALILADSFLEWLKDEGVCCGTFTGDAVPEGAAVTDNPVFYGEMAAFLLQLGEEKYTAAALRAIDRIGKNFPAVAPFGFSDNFTFSRWLLMLSAAQYHTDVDFSEKIAPVLEFFSSLQEPCGGLRETPIRLEKHPEAGIGIGDGSDAIADLLYCNNFVFNALSILRNLPPEKCRKIDMELVSSMYDSLRRFFLEIQIKSPDPRLDGGWMRGYDMQLNEYYGLNKDLDWGSYCIMAGWVMAFVPMVFLTEEYGESFFF